MEDIGKAWLSINSLCIKEYNLANKEKWSLIKLNVWKSSLEQYFTEFANLSKLLQVMVATPANTSPLEQNYTRLQIIAPERRNHLQPKNVKVLYPLASLKDQVEPRDPGNYEKAHKTA